MIVLDTHVWVWWVQGDPRLPDRFGLMLDTGTEELGVSVFSCWEVAKLVELKRLTLPLALDLWLRSALAYPNVRLLDLNVDVAVASTQLPAPFHRDPTDQIIVATARVHGSRLLTLDREILAYPHVQLVP